MSGISKKMLQAAAGQAGELLAIEDVFSTYLYTGNGSTRTITNGIDLAGEGGLVWVKQRNGTRNHYLASPDFFYAPNPQYGSLKSDSTANLFYSKNTFGDSLWGNNGFNVGTTLSASGETYVSWSFRKAPRFFDVVTYTGNGVANTQIPHNLGVAPHVVIIKKTNDTSVWSVFHRSLYDNVGADQIVTLNTNEASAGREYFGEPVNIPPTDSYFTIGDDSQVNRLADTYVAYLFAHDPLGPSGDGSDGLIACGSYTGNGSTDGPEIDLGWESQWLLVKRADSTGDWNLIDNMRGFTAGGDDAELNPNLSDVESTGTFVSPTSTGFRLSTTDAGYNTSGGTYIYIAIRRGPMRAPESGTEVFSPVALDSSPNSNVDTGFPPDFIYWNARTDTSLDTKNRVADRLRGFKGGTSNFAPSLFTNQAAAEYSNDFDADWLVQPFPNNGFRVGSPTPISIRTNIFYALRRAPGFFDVVAYSGDAVNNRDIPHNLGVTPEFEIVKARNIGDNWMASTTSLGDGYFKLNEPEVFDNTNTERLLASGNTSTTFRVGDNESVNGSTYTYIAYLFATLPGVSKVGSYTGNGTNQTIDCGFTSGARFILIKRTDSTGDWYVWDTARGIVAGDDPFLELNTTDAEVTTDDSIDPDGSGFVVNQTATTNINVSSGEYIFLAIA